ncbi:TetR/AcrR family transcriptional regulator [Arthrobacter sp. CAU 1506]|uniref:TetR/AcrR family transcriptional regulator n=1 Tax=Arthrobacter sp. CAU 1506 TaxID=2560052 RepID=UPI001F0F7A32|nr:TetR/AcrR family transcriptional regulator [Arthrobacter sp. CAU 1506]
MKQRERPARIMLVRMSLRLAQKNMTRNLILESGLRLFQDQGYAATKVEDIAASVGANRTTFYRHFSSKEQLMIALIEKINDQVVSSDKPRLAQVAEVGDREQIRTWIARRFNQWPLIMPYVSVARQAAGMDPTIAAAVEAWLQSPVDEIQAGLDAAGRFEPKSRRARGVLAFGQIEFLSMEWVHEGWGNRLDRESSLEAMTDTWCLLIGR